MATSNEVTYLVYSKSLGEVIGFSDDLDTAVTFMEERDMFSLDLSVVKSKIPLQDMVDFDELELNSSREICNFSMMGAYIAPGTPCYITDLEFTKISIVIENFIERTISPFNSLLSIMREHMKLTKYEVNVIEELEYLADDILNIFSDGSDELEIFFSLSFIALYEVSCTYPAKCLTSTISPM